MKKLTIILLFLFGFTSLEITAQTESDIPLDKGANGMIYRNTGGADRGSTSNVFGTQGQWTSDLTISEKSSSQALAMGWEGTAHIGMGATGWASFTGGAYNRASGVGSVAFGFHNVAGSTSSDVNTIDGNNIGQTAFGYGTLASGNASFTSGQGTEGSGSFSTSAGYYTTASDYGSFVIGSWNLSGSTVTSATAFSASAPAFVIGNGTANNSRSDAFKILFNGTTTIAGSVTASAFIGDGSQLTNLPSGTNGSDGNGIASTTDNNDGTFTLTFDDTSTFTTSDLTGPTGTTGPTGNPGANGTNGADGAQGSQGNGIASTTDNNDGTFTLTFDDTSTFTTSDLTGPTGTTGPTGNPGADGTGDYNDLLNIPINFNDNNLNGIQSPTNIATGDYSIALGTNNIATGDYSTALGATNTASGYASTSMGDSNWASGRASTAIGAGTIAQDYGMFSMGIWSEPLNDSNPAAEDFALTNTAFLIGNGLDADNRSNAVQILFDGTTTIAGDLNINSDARLKANILSLGATLSKLLQIDGKTYTMKKDSNDKKKIGLLAQDIEKVFPELVTETNDIKSVNYQGLIPVLINAMKEQQSEIDELKEKESNYLQQEKRLEKLEQIISNMEK